MITKTPNRLAADRDWYKHAVIYQSHVRAFSDSDGNGIGDFRGLTSRLEYLKDLGVTAVWLLPFYPSPLRDDGYDIADYSGINPIYGDLADFQEFLARAHKLGLRVITELVVNHTSDQHAWFQRARRAPPGSPWRDFYVWSDDPNKYADARIIFKDFEVSNWTWDPVANAHFWHRFYSHQPDLNFENPAVHEELLKVLDFWLQMGVDGLRLDAVPYLYEQEGTNCENLPQTHAFLRKLRSYVDEKYGDRMLLAEANQWPEDAVAYFGAGAGDECHMAFHFPLMPRLFMAVRMEDRVPIEDILEQTPPIPETSQWALFLRNHDELTLEMVTDEERDYMYRVYAQDPNARINLGIRRRLAPLLGNNRRRIELLNALLFSLPGTPVLYYGDEIGMGENTFLGDRNGVRTPMQWSSDRNAGFSRANPQALYLPVIVDPEYHYQTVNVEAQEANPHSLLWWMRRFLALRKQWKAFGEGSIEFLHPENRKVLVYIRRFHDETLLVVANLSRFVQPVELDLSAWQQRVPVELFGRTRFPVITHKPYFLTLSPHGFYWFSLEARFENKTVMHGRLSGIDALPLITVADRWESLLLEDSGREQLAAILQDYVRERRWFGGKAKEITSVEITEAVAIPAAGGEQSFLTIVSVAYVDGDPEMYSVPIAFAGSEQSAKLHRESPHLMIARLQVDGGRAEGTVYDAMGSQAFCRALMEAVAAGRTFQGLTGTVQASATEVLPALTEGGIPEPAPVRAEHSNSAVTFGDRLIFKLYRRLDMGVNPDLEIGRFLTAKKFPHVAPVAGALEYSTRQKGKITLGIVHGFVANAKDGWEYTLDAVGRYYERVQGFMTEQAREASTGATLFDWIDRDLPAHVNETLGTYFATAHLLGQRTAELHIALASERVDKDFAPEPFSPHYQRSLYQSMRNLFTHNLQLLKKRLTTLPEDVQRQAEQVLQSENEINKRLRAVYERRIVAMRIRNHGDYHLGQVLHTGKDFVILDFEGEPARSLGERRIKRGPARDVAGMIRSFHYVAFAALAAHVQRGSVPPENAGRFEPWARYWFYWVSVVFLKSYLAAIKPANLLPPDQEGFKALLDANLLDKAIYEIGYELNNRPDWLPIPLQGVLQLLEHRTMGSP